MKNDVIECVRTIQTSMLESARSCFSEAELDDLCCLIRLAVEFNNYLQTGNPQLRDVAQHLRHCQGGDIQIQPKGLELRYSGESIFSGIDSFCSVSAAYRVVDGATNSEVEWSKISMSSLKELFVFTFHKFNAETNFEKKCRLLLDLFKIQIVFAGVFYD